MIDYSSRIRSPWSYLVTYHVGGAVAHVAENAYGDDKYHRLATLKYNYDPDNISSASVAGT